MLFCILNLLLFWWRSLVAGVVVGSCATRTFSDFNTKRDGFCNPGSWEQVKYLYKFVSKSTNGRRCFETAEHGNELASFCKSFIISYPRKHYKYWITNFEIKLESLPHAWMCKFSLEVLVYFRRSGFCESAWISFKKCQYPWVFFSTI